MKKVIEANESLIFEHYCPALKKAGITYEVTESKQASAKLQLEGYCKVAKCADDLDMALYVRTGMAAKATTLLSKLEEQLYEEWGRRPTEEELKSEEWLKGLERQDEEIRRENERPF